MSHPIDGYRSDPAGNVLYSTGRAHRRDGSLSSTMDGQPASVPMGEAKGFDGGWTGGDFNSFFIVAANIDYVLTWRSLPLSVSETEVEFNWFVAEDAVDGRDYDVKSVTAMWEHTFGEDTAITERNQHGLMSNAYELGQLSLREAPVAAFHEWYAQEMQF